MLDVVRLLKFLIVLVFFLYACKLDLKSRIVPNVVWTRMILVSIPFLAIELINMPTKLLLLGVFQFIFIFFLSYLLYFIGAMGGADAKALIALAIIYPVYPTCFVLPLFGIGLGMFAFATLANSVIVTPLLFLYMFFRNLFVEGIRNIRGNVLYYFIAKRARVTEIPDFHNLLEYIDEKGEFVRVKLGIEPNDELINRLKSAGIENVWVTPAIPFLLFITFGYVVAFVFGDILFILLKNFLTFI